MDQRKWFSPLQAHNNSQIIDMMHQYIVASCIFLTPLRAPIYIVDEVSGDRNRCLAGSPGFFFFLQELNLISPPSGFKVLLVLTWKKMWEAAPNCVKSPGVGSYIVVHPKCFEAAKLLGLLKNARQKIQDSRLEKKVVYQKKRVFWGCHLCCSVHSRVFMILCSDFGGKLTGF